MSVCDEGVGDEYAVCLQCCVRLLFVTLPLPVACSKGSVSAVSFLPLKQELSMHSVPFQDERDSMYNS